MKLVFLCYTLPNLVRFPKY